MVALSSAKRNAAKSPPPVGKPCEQPPLVSARDAGAASGIGHLGDGEITASFERRAAILTASAGVMVACFIAFSDRVLIVPFTGGQTAVAMNIVAPVIGLLAAIAAELWIGFSDNPANCRDRQSAQAHPHRHSELTGHLTAVKIQVGILLTNGVACLNDSPCGIAQKYLDFVDAQLEIPGHHWKLQTGYVDMWTHLQNAEEALFAVKAVEEVVVDALTDLMRLRGSKILHADELRAELCRAVTVLGGADYLPPLAAVSANGGAHGANGLAARTRIAERFHGNGTGNGAHATPCNNLLQARLVAGSVRNAINEYRDLNRFGLLRARNRVVRAGTFTIMAAFSLLVLVMLAGIPRDCLIAASAFYLVGALVGLFRRLQGDVKISRSADDLGLGRARLTYTPLLAGVAAVLGVPATRYLSADLAHTVIPTLSDIFNLSKNPANLLVAAVFGLTPDLLISRLQTQAESYKTNLESTAVHEGSNP
jgi:hypothetical protein